MAAVISSESLGLYNSSLNTVGGGGNATVGQQGNQVYINAANGNLVVRQRDEFIASQTANLSVLRTYNSQGHYDGDNDDRWQLNVFQYLDVAGGPNEIVKYHGDGHIQTFVLQGNVYVNTDGSGAHDTLEQRSQGEATEWVWTSGDGTLKEIYNGDGDLLYIEDADGHTWNYVYGDTTGLIEEIYDNNGQSVLFNYVGENLQSITTISNSITQSRVSYTYDNNRLKTVAVDLSPEDNSTADGHTFTTTYEYLDATSKLIKSIEHSDGSRISFTYDAQNRIETVTEGSGTEAHTTTYRYGETTQEQQVNANNAVLQDTINEVTYTGTRDDAALQTVIDNSVYADLNDTTNSLQTQEYMVGEPTAAQAIVPTGNTQAISNLQVVNDTNGNRFAIWEQNPGGNRDLYFSQYNANTGQWSVATEFHDVTSDLSKPRASYDAAGNITVVWYQGYSLYTKRYDQVAGTWSDAVRLGGVSRENHPELSVDAAGNVMVVWEDLYQKTLTVARYDINTGLWTNTILVEDSTQQLISYNIALNDQGEALLYWGQKVEVSGQANTLDIYYSRYDPVNGWQAPAQIDTGLYFSHGAVDLKFNNQGDGILIWGENGGGGRVAAMRYTNGAWENTSFNVESPVEWMNNHPQVHLDEAGNAIVLWESNIIKARRFDVNHGWGETVKLTHDYSGHNYHLQIEGTADGHAVAMWQDNGQVQAARYEAGVGWHDTQNVAGVDTLNGTGLSVDSNGSAQLLWVNTDASSNVTVQSSQTDYIQVTVPAYYIAQAGDTWESIAQKFYGTSEVAYALQAATGNLGRTLVPGLKLNNIPATLNNAQEYELNTQTLNPINQPLSAVQSLTPSGNTQAVSNVQIATDKNGNRFAVWEQNTGSQTDLYYSEYNAATGEWSVAAELYSGTTGSVKPTAHYDEKGNVTVAWYRGYQLVAQHYDKTKNEWSEVFGIGYIFRHYWPKISSDALGNVTVIGSNYNSGTVILGHYDINTARWRAETIFEDDNLITGDYHIGQNAQGQIMAVWHTYEGSTRTYYYDLFTPGQGWQGAQVFHTGPHVGQTKIDFSFNDNGEAVLGWVEQHNGTAAFINAMRYSAGQWQSIFELDTQTAVWLDSDAEVFLDAQGNATVLWEANAIKTRRYDINTGWGETIEHEATPGAGNLYQRIAGNDDGHIAISWRWNGSLNVREYIPGQGWQAIQQMAYTGSMASADISVDENGNAQLVWVANDNGLSALNTTQLSASQVSYTVAANDTWESIATNLYGQASLAHELSIAMNQAAPAVGETITLPLSLVEGGADTMAPYYIIQTNDTWETIAYAIYGNGLLSEELSAALGNPALQAGALLTGFPETLDDIQPTTVPYYYDVQAGDTWADIVLAVYGNNSAELSAALQAALGFPSLSEGLHLTLPQSLFFSSLSQQANTTSVIDPQGRISSYVYDGEGKLTSMLSPALKTGQRLTTHYQYDGDDNVTHITDGRGNTIQYNYNSDGTLNWQRDAAGNYVEYGYTDSNQLASETVYLVPDPDGEGSGVAAEPQTTHYVYDSEDHLRFIVDASGGVTEHRYAANGDRETTVIYTSHVYTNTANVAEADLSTWVSSMTDLSQTQRSDYTYDFRGQLSSSTTYSSMAANGAPSDASVTHYIYDQSGRLLKTVDARGNAPVNNGVHQAGNFETHYVYDGLGRLTQATDAKGSTTHTLYNDANQRIETLSANGLVQTSVYDSHGRLISISEYNVDDLVTVYDTDGRLNDINGHNTANPLSQGRSVYDANGRLRASQDPNGVITHSLYDRAGRLVATVDGVGALTENIYDENNQITQQIRYANVLNSEALARLINTDANGILQSANDVPLDQVRPQAQADDRYHFNYYDKADRLAFTIDGEGYVTEYQYDGAGQLTDTIKHSAPFPGFINNDAAGADVTITSAGAILEWVNGGLEADSKITTSIIEEETGNTIKVNVDLATNTGTVETSRVPTQIFETDNYAVSDTRTLMTDSETVSLQYLTDETAGATSINRTTAYQVTSSNVSLSVTNGSVNTTSNVSKSGSTYTISGLSYGYETSIYWTATLIGASGTIETKTYLESNYSYPPTSISYDNLAPGSYTVRTLTRVPTGSGKNFTAEYRNFSFTIGHVEDTVINLPSVTGATQVDFLHRISSGSGGAGYTVDNEHGFTIHLDDYYNQGSESSRDFKVIYKNSSGSVIAVGAGHLDIEIGGTTTVSNFTVYKVASTGSGAFLRQELNGTEVGNVGDDLPTTLGHVEAFVYQAGTTIEVSSAITYPSVVKELTGEVVVNLSMANHIPDGFYDIVINKYYPNGTSAGSKTISNYQVGVDVDHIQEITWSAGIHTMGSHEGATFYYRLKDVNNPQPYTALAFDGNPILEIVDTYFTRSGSQYKARLFGLDESADYEFYIEYRASDERLLKWSGSADAPNAFNVNQTTDLAIDFQYNQDESSNANGGTRIFGFLPPQEVQAIDYLSVNVIDAITNTKVNAEPIITIPRVESNYLGTLNISDGAPLADGRYRIEVTRYFKNEALEPKFDHFMHEVGMQIHDSITHTHAVDDLATIDTRTLIQENVAISTDQSTHVIPQVVSTGSRSYELSAAQTLNLQVTNATTTNSSNVSQSGSTFTISGLSYGPETSQFWSATLRNSSGTVLDTTSYPESGGQPPSSKSYSNLAPGSYTVQTLTRVPTGSGKNYIAEYSTTAFTIAQTVGSVVHIPSVSGASQVDFYHRAESSTSGSYVLDSEHDFNIGISSSYNNQWRDFKILYKNSSGQIIKVSVGKFYSDAGDTTNRTIYAYGVDDKNGTYLSNVLTSSEMGQYGDETGSTLRYVTANVYLAGTNTLVSSVRTYPVEAKLIYGFSGNRINLTVGSTLPHGFYDIVIDKRYNNVTTVTAAQRLDNVQIGDIHNEIQDISWSSSVHALGAGETATFFYRQSGASSFTAIPLTTSASGDKHFTQSGGEYKVHLYDIAASQNYDYYIEYRGSDQRLLKSSGSAVNPNVFNSATTGSSNAVFSHYEVGSTKSNNDNGTRITGYLTASEVAATDYMSVNVIDDATNATVYSDVLTVPRAQNNYQGELNLSPYMELLPGRYRLEVTRYFNDESITPQQETIIHEITHEITGVHDLSFTTSGDVVTASYNGSDLYFAGGLSLDIDVANDTLAWNLDQIINGPYSYSERIENADATSFTEDSGRLAVYPGDSPTVDALRDFYSRDREINVTVEQGTAISYRSPVLPTGVGYAGSAQGTTTVEHTSDFELTVVADPTDNSSHVLPGNIIDVSDIGSGVYRYVSVIDVSTGSTIYSQSAPEMHERWYSTWTGFAGDEWLRQSPRLTTFALPTSVTSNPGNYVIRVNNVLASRSERAIRNRTGNGWDDEVITIERYSFGTPVDTEIRIGGLPQTATVSWDASSLPTGATYTFKFGSAGGAIDRNPDSLQLANGNVIANLGNESAGFYDYVIEYRDVNGDLLNKSEGRFEIKIGGNHTTVAHETMVEHEDVGVVINGSSIIYHAYAAQGNIIDQIQVMVTNKATGLPVTGWVITEPSTFENYIGQINLQAETPLDDGAYDIKIITTYNNGGANHEPPVFTIEIGQQKVESPSTELRWDATDRPPNTDVYFIYKSTAVARFAENMWIRATASQSLQGEYYVRFPQLTPDGKHQLDSLPEGEYDYMVGYFDRDTGKQVETTLGSFAVKHEPGLLANHEVVFTRDLDARHERSFYNERGQLQAVLNAMGYLTENIYDASGRLVEVIQYALKSGLSNAHMNSLDDLRPDASADDIHSYVKYNNQGWLVLSVDAEGYVKETVYDAVGNVTRIIEYAEATTSTDILNDDIATVRPISSNEDRVVENVYTALNQVSQTTSKVGNTVISVNRFEFDSVGNLIQATAGVGASDERTLQSRYDLQGRLTSSLNAEGGQALKDLLQANPNASQAEIDLIWQQYAMHYQYDASGQQTQVTDQNNHSNHAYYDERGALRYSINAEGEVQEIIYNRFGQASQTIRYANRVDEATLASLAGGLLTQTTRGIFDALRDLNKDSVLEQSYDNRGLVVEQKDALGYQTHYQYNAFGQSRFEHDTSSDGSAYTVERIYDDLGREITTLGIGADGQLNVGTDYDAFNRVKNTYTYDHNRNLFDHYHNQYDKLGRLTETFEVIDAVEAELRSINGFTYDAFGRVATQVDAAGEATTYTYDDVNRTVTITTPEQISSSTKTNRHGETVEVSDANGNVTTFDYDKNGQLIKTTDAENNETTHEYDKAGRLTFSTDANGTRVETKYDATNRVIERIVDPNGLNISTQTVYDAKGRVIQSIDPNGIVTQTYYDKKGQVVAVIIDPAPSGAETSNQEHLSLSTFYTYDSRGNQLTVSVGGQPGVIDTTDESGNPIQAYAKAINTTSYQYDSHGRLISETIDPTVTWTDNQNIEHTEEGLNITKQYHYDAQGNVAAQTNARGYTTRTVHDKFGRLIYTFAELELDQALVTKNHYDDNGRLLAVTQYANTVSLYDVDIVMSLEKADEMTSGLASSDDRLQQQVYDKDGRLIYTISPTGLLSENIYDDNGNIIEVIAYSEAVAAGNYTSVADVQAALSSANDNIAEQHAWSVYDANSRALFNIDALGYVTANEYDNNSNLIKSTRFATAIDITILNDATDNRSQLETLITTLGSGSDQVMRYTYDNANRQVYAIDALGYITKKDYDAAGQVKALIQFSAPYVEANGLPVTTSAEDRITQSAFDGAGRIIATSDALGNIEQYEYDVAGNRIAYINANGDTWTYHYDAANRMIEEHSPVVTVTQLDATLFEENFDATTDLSNDYVGELAVSGATHALTDGRLTLKNNAQATDLEAGLVGGRNYEFDQHRRFETTFTVGEDIQAIQLAISAGNLQSSISGRYHSLYVNNGTLVSAYFDGNDITYTPVEGITLEANQTYIVEIGSETELLYDEIEVDYSVLSVYISGQSRDEAFVDRKQTDWADLSGAGQSLQSLVIGFTSKANQTTNEAVHIDQLRELMPFERALMNEAAHLTTQSSQQSVVTKIEYNAMGDVTSRVEAVGTVNERTTSYVYDTMNRQIKSIYPQVGVYSYNDENMNFASSRQDTLQTLSDHTYFDVFGNAVLGIDTAGNRSYKVYDENNRLVYDIDANGYVTENQYDAFGNVVELIRYADAINLPTSNISTLNPGMSITDVELELASSSQDRNLVYTYDALNRVTKTEQASVSVVTGLDANGNATMGAASPTTQQEYDSFGRIIKQSVLSDGGWLDSYFYYDHNGRQLGTVDPMGYVTLNEYNLVGSITRQVHYAKAINLDSTTLNLYDWTSVNSHIVVSAAVPNTESISGFDRETRFVYDHLDRLTSQTQVNVLISEANVANAGSDDYDATFTQSVTDLTTSFAYDAVGNRVSLTDADGNTIYQFYDALGRVTGETQVTRTQQRYGIANHTSVLVENAGGDSAQLRWARPPIPGLTAELKVRTAGSSNAWTTLTVVASGTELSASIGHLPSDQYEYELSYTRTGESQVYATAKGVVNVDTNKVSGSGLSSGYVAYRVTDKGNTLYISGNTAGITKIDIGGTIYQLSDFASLGNGNYSFDLNAYNYNRGNYEFTIELGSPENSVSGMIQKLSGDMGGEIAIQTADIEIEYEITKRAKFHYTDVNEYGRIVNGYWDDNRIEITVPSLDRLGTEAMHYEVILEFRGASGTATKERTFTGLVSGNTIVLTPEYGYTLEYSEPGHLTRLVSVKLKRGDVETATEIVRQNYQLAYLMEGRRGMFNPEYTYTETAYHDYDVVFESTGGVDTQQLEFINLPENAKTATFTFWPSGEGSDAKVERTLNRIGQGYFSLGYRDIPPGVYEYEIRINGSSQVIKSGSNFVMGNGLDGYQSISQPDLASENQEALLTPLTRYQYDHFGNAVSVTRYANSAQFNLDGTVNVALNKADDQVQYNFYDTHGHVVHQQDAEGAGIFYSYDERGNIAKQWQWVSTDEAANVAGHQLFKGMVYRYDAVGQKTESIEVAENITIQNVGIGDRVYTQALTKSEYNAFGEVAAKHLIHRHAGQADNVLRTEYFEYDQAGRVWRSNAEDGIDKINLYDAQGNVVQQIVSQGRDFSGSLYSELDTIAAYTTDVMKTSYVYDDLGRVIKQLLPSRQQGSTTFRPEIELQVDRWGNVTRQIDADNIITDVRYNQSNKQIKMVQAVGVGIEIIDETGAPSNVTPTSYTHYDKYGRDIGSVDANGNERVKEYDKAGQVIGAFAGDGGVQRFVYDVFGNAVESVVFRGTESTQPYITRKIFDRNNRLVLEETPGGGETHYTYNEAGDRTHVKRLVYVAKANDTQYGAMAEGDRRYETTEYRYDNRGNLIEEILNARIDVFDSNGEQKDFTINNAPVEHRYAYDMQGNKVVEQMYKTALETDTLESTWEYDYFGRLVDRNDFGGGDYDYDYNEVGQLISETVTRTIDKIMSTGTTTETQTETKTYGYYDDGLLESITRNNFGNINPIVTDSYEYDINGRITKEHSDVDLPENGNIYTNTYTYDALGRLKTFVGRSDDQLIFAGYTNQEYGPNEVESRGYWLEASYEYDAMGNRRRVHGREGMSLGYSYLTHDPEKGGTEVIINDAFALTPFDQWYTYDAENRVLISRGILDNGEIKLDQGEMGNNIWKEAEGSIKYTYDKAGNRVQADYYRAVNDVPTLMVENHIYDADGRVLQTTVDGLNTSQRTYDLLGRTLTYISYSSPGTPEEHRISTFNDNGQLATQTVYQADGAGNPTGTWTALIRYDYTDSYDHTGAVKHYSMQTGTTSASVNDYTYEYYYYDSAKNSRTIRTGSGPASISFHVYDAHGNLVNVHNSGPSSFGNLTYRYNAAGQMIHKGRYAPSSRSHDFFYLFNGRIIGKGGSAGVDFDYTSTPLSQAEATTGPSQYAVRDGDTLQSIALAVYGDSQRWYLIADANGILSNAQLTPGQTLTIPGNVQSLRNSTEAFRVYNSSELIGDTTPAMPGAAMSSLLMNAIPEEKSNAFVQIVAVIVEVVVTIVLTPFMGPAAGIVGNLAGQAVRILGGEQDGLDQESLIKSMKMAAFSSMASAIGTGAGITTNMGPVGRAITNNVISQGLQIATGHQESFSWGSLASAGLGEAVGQGISGTGGFANLGEHFMANFAGSTLQQMIDNEDGQEIDWGQTALNAFGQAIGNSIGGEIKRSRTIDFMEKENAKLGRKYFNTSSDREIEFVHKNPEIVQAGLNQLKAGSQTENSASPTSQIPDIEITYNASSANQAENRGDGQNSVNGASTQTENLQQNTKMLSSNGGDNKTQNLADNHAKVVAADAVSSPQDGTGNASQKTKDKVKVKKAGAQMNTEDRLYYKDKNGNYYVREGKDVDAKYNKEGKLIEKERKKGRFSKKLRDKLPEQENFKKDFKKFKNHDIKEAKVNLYKTDFLGNLETTSASSDAFVEGKIGDENFGASVEALKGNAAVSLTGAVTADKNGASATISGSAAAEMVYLAVEANVANENTGTKLNAKGDVRSVASANALLKGSIGKSGIEAGVDAGAEVALFQATGSASMTQSLFGGFIDFTVKGEGTASALALGGKVNAALVAKHSNGKTTAGFKLGLGVSAIFGLSGKVSGTFNINWNKLGF